MFRLDRTEASKSRTQIVLITDVYVQWLHNTLKYILLYFIGKRVNSGFSSTALDSVLFIPARPFSSFNIRKINTMLFSSMFVGQMLLSIMHRSRYLVVVAFVVVVLVLVVVMVVVVMVRVMMRVMAFPRGVGVGALSPSSYFPRHRTPGPHGWIRHLFAVSISFKVKSAYCQQLCLVSSIPGIENCWLSKRLSSRSPPLRTSSFSVQRALSATVSSVSAARRSMLASLIPSTTEGSNRDGSFWTRGSMARTLRSSTNLFKATYRST